MRLSVELMALANFPTTVIWTSEVESAQWRDELNG